MVNLRQLSKEVADELGIQPSVVNKIGSHFFKSLGEAMDSTEYDKVQIRGFIGCRAKLYKTTKKLKKYIAILRKDLPDNVRESYEIKFRKVWALHKRRLTEYFKLSNREINKRKLTPYE